MPASIPADASTHGVFKVLVDCDGVVVSVDYQNGEMSDAQADDMGDVIKDMVFTPAVKDGDNVKTNVFISLKITSGTPTSAVH